LLDYAIVFALGFLIAGLLSFAMLPIVWRRALRLTRRQLEAVIPLSMEEVRARQDAIRAEAAIETRRLEARIEAERDRRHAAMAAEGRLSERVGRLTTELASRDAELARFADSREESQASVADAQQLILGLKAEIAAAKVNLTLRDKMVEDGKRALDGLTMDNDGLRVEVVAMRTKLGTAEDDLAQRRRDIDELTAAGIDRDGRIALQGRELAGRIDAVAMLEGQLVALERRLAAAEEGARSAESLRTELDEARRTGAAALSTLEAADIERREAALAEHQAALEAATARESELRSEIQALRSEAQRSVGELANGVASLRHDRQVILAQLEDARGERSRLQAEVELLKREARESWLAIEADNQQLRIAMARIAAEIARQAGQGRVAGGQASLPGGEAPRLAAPRLSLPDPAA
jgi:chromosome segregation ATPase